ncbi:MAG: hypothetical protein NTX86_01520, partial [Candidatus Dependentiae bacterium]|nr:hypothetical protein [Candidatus Dependentiae bacterium]
REMRGALEQAKGVEGKLEEIMQEKGAKKEVVQRVNRTHTEWGPALFAIHHKDDADVYVDNGVGVILQLTHIEPSYVPTLDAIEDVVKNDMYEEKAARAVQEALLEARQKGNSATLQQLKETYNGTVEATGFLTKTDDKATSAFGKKDIPTDEIFQLEKVGALYVHSHGKDGHLVRLDEIGSFNQEQFDAKKEVFTRETEREVARLFMAGFVASLYRNATIEKNESISTTQYEE